MSRLLTSIAAAVVAAAAVVLSAPAAFASAADDSAEITWSVEPSDDEGPDERVSLRHELAAGGSVSDHVAVTNYSAEPATFAVYASDGIVSATGDFDLLPGDVEPTDGGSWVEIGDVEGGTAREGGGVVVEVAAGESTVIPVEIEVPENVTPGDHPAGIVAELVLDDGSSVQMSSRVGVRAHLRVEGDIVAQLTPQDVVATYTPSWNPFAPGTVDLEYTVVNTGNVRLGAVTDASVAGPFGIAAASASAESREILPGQQSVYQAQLAVWPLFLGRGEITAEPLVVGDDEVPVEPTATVAAFSVWTIPWVQLATIAALVIAVVLLIRSRRRSAAKVQAKIDAAVAAAVATSKDDEPPSPISPTA